MGNKVSGSLVPSKWIHAQIPKHEENKKTNETFSATTSAGALDTAKEFSLALKRMKGRRKRVHKMVIPTGQPSTKAMQNKKNRRRNTNPSGVKFFMAFASCSLLLLRSAARSYQNLLFWQQQIFHCEKRSSIISFTICNTYPMILLSLPLASSLSLSLCLSAWPNRIPIVEGASLTRIAHFIMRSSRLCMSWIKT